MDPNKFLFFILGLYDSSMTKSKDDGFIYEMLEYLQNHSLYSLQTENQLF